MQRSVLAMAAAAFSVILLSAGSAQAGPYPFGDEPYRFNWGYDPEVASEMELAAASVERSLPAIRLSQGVHVPTRVACGVAHEGVGRPRKRRAASERFRAKWIPVRVKKTRRKNARARF
jgi:hypothetical protein